MKEYRYKINGKDYSVRIESVDSGIAKVNVNGTDYDVELPVKECVCTAVKRPDSSVTVTSVPAAKAADTAPAGGKTVSSPLPGVILDIFVKEGQSVRRGEKIAVLEAMKMENEIQATADGTVIKVFVNKGESILEGAGIITIG